MIAIRQQRGAALFVGIFLITVVVVFAAVVALTSSTQHLSQARAQMADQAWYEAIGRIEEAVQYVVRNDNCPSGGTTTLFNFSTTLSCTKTSVSEGSDTYGVYNLEVTASQGSLSGAILVRRTVRSQVTDLGS